MDGQRGRGRLRDHRPRERTCLGPGCMGVKVFASKGPGHPVCAKCREKVLYGKGPRGGGRAA